MHITYIYHSCFVVEGDQEVVVFDYWKDPANVLHRLLHSTDKQIYFVISHFHEDHCSPELQQWLGSGLFAKPPRILASYDTVKHRRIDKSNVLDIMLPNKFYEDEHLKINYYRSTDIGVSSLITFSDGTTVFHAGDLNNWYFADGTNIKVTPDEMEGMYLSVVRDIRAAFPSINHAMLPFDPRLESNMLRGPMQFLNKIYVDNIYPMHFWHRHSLMADTLAQLQQLFPTTTFWYPMPLPQDC